jgi:hypothetical protein
VSESARVAPEDNLTFSRRAANLAAWCPSIWPCTNLTKPNDRAAVNCSASAFTPLYLLHAVITASARQNLRTLLHQGAFHRLMLLKRCLAVHARINTHSNVTVAACTEMVRRRVWSRGYSGLSCWLRLLVPRDTCLVILIRMAQSDWRHVVTDDFRQLSACRKRTPDIARTSALNGRRPRVRIQLMHPWSRRAGRPIGAQPQCQSTGAWRPVYVSLCVQRFQWVRMSCTEMAFLASCETICNRRSLASTSNTTSLQR